ncbi:tetratricopeptide repeat protein [Cohaesibacter haloalkalitolerans]|uniref:tetratricopeptide repeat protein n=1 Tax=Cohaesibacter haloalkalitolerans TaxID=1162980 RepID=UPI0013C48B8B|nr:tetratricopeptide repeat protein [Cohaesibacter haloalkalitolerans]
MKSNNRIHLTLLLVISSLLFSCSANASELKSRVVRVMDEGKVLLSVPQKREDVPLGSHVRLFAELPGLGAISIQTLWLVESVSGDGIVAAPQDAPSGEPQIGYQATIIPALTLSPSVDNIQFPKETKEQRQISDLLSKAGALAGPDKSNQNNREAFNLWRQAAALGSHEAEVLIGIAYAFGFGVEVDELAALSWFERAGKNGSSDGQLRAGLFYAMGYGTKKDPKQAFEWFLKAGEAGNTKAMLFLSDAYEDGKGVQTDAFSALKWLKRAARNNSPLASRVLAELYFEGEKEQSKVLAEKNEGLALFYLLKAANAGLYDAARDLSKRYESGDGVPVDEALAKIWENKANRINQQGTSKTFEEPYCLAKDECYGPDGIRRRFKKVANNEIEGEGNYHNLGNASDNRHLEEDEHKFTQKRNGNSLEMSKEEAVALGDAERKERLAQYNDGITPCDRLAAHAQDLDAVAPGVSYSDLKADQVVNACQLALNNAPDTRRFHVQIGRGYYKLNEFAKAADHFQQAVAFGSAQAMAYLGVMYKVGNGMPLNASVALDWFQRSADLNNLAGMHFAASMYRSGEGGRKNLTKAADLYQKAAQRDLPDAIFVLALMLDKGEGIGRDPMKSAQYLLRAYYLDFSRTKDLLMRYPDRISQQTRWNIQNMLAKDGCYFGKLDGIFGQQTFGALKLCKDKWR